MGRRGVGQEDLRIRQHADDEDRHSGPGAPISHRAPGGISWSKRMGSNLKIVDTSKVTEDRRWRRAQLRPGQRGRLDRRGRSGVREGDDMVVFQPGARPSASNLPRLSALGPEAVRRLSNAVPPQAGPAFFPSIRSARNIRRTFVIESGKNRGPGNARCPRVPAQNCGKLSSEVSFMPGMASTTWVDDGNNDVESVTVLPGLGTLHEYTTGPRGVHEAARGRGDFSPRLLIQPPARAPLAARPGAGRLPPDPGRSQPEDHALGPGRAARFSLPKPGSCVRGSHRADFSPPPDGDLAVAPTPIRRNCIATSRLRPTWRSMRPKSRRLDGRAVGNEKKPDSSPRIRSSASSAPTSRRKTSTSVFGSAEETGQVARGRLHGARGVMRGARPRRWPAYPVRRRLRLYSARRG